MSPRSLGVEEEFLLVEPGTGRPQAVAGTILRAARPELEAELQEQRLTAQEQLTCGCHVHVGIGSAEEGVAVLDRSGPWLATLLALSANSPCPSRSPDLPAGRRCCWLPGCGAG